MDDLMAISSAELEANAMAEVRAQRDQALVVSDIYVLADVWKGLSDTDKAAIKTYRQALRDIPQQGVAVADVV